MFARYCALLSDHGVTRPGPESSLSTITGVAHPVCCCAKAKNVFTRPGMSDGFAGAVVVPIAVLQIQVEVDGRRAEARASAGQ